MSFLLGLWTKPYIQWTLIDSLALYADIAIVLILIVGTKRLLK